LHQVGDLFEINVKLRCQKVNGAIKSVINKLQRTPFGIFVSFSNLNSNYKF
jgi:Txe/YoeB family toxin of Txe-Axe toxin-antitoxin module